MRILGLDTATRATAVALLDTERPGEAVQRRDDPPPGVRPGHTAHLLELIRRVMQDAAVDWPQIDRLAVGIGPGTFTGLRIGIATALGLARARDLALVPILTLRSLAAAPDAPEAEGGSIAAVIDARRGEVFAAAWSAGEAAQPTAEPWLAPAPLAPSALAELLAAREEPVLAVGDGALAFREALAPSRCRIPSDDSPRHRVSALAHCRLAAEMAPVAPEALRPEYLRLPDAEISRQAVRR